MLLNIEKEAFIDDIVFEYYYLSYYLSLRF